MAGSAARAGWRQRFFAWFTANESTSGYDDLVEPYKQALLSGLSGAVLEIGAGTGANFAYYPPGIRWIGIEPNVFMHPHLLEAANAHGIIGEVRAEVAERLPVEDASIDAVVSTLVMCSVSNQRGVLSEIRRVLRPGGRYVFVEHVAAPEHSPTWWVQKLIKPFWSALGDGCQPDRDTAAAIERAGFSQVEIQTFRAPLPVASPHIAGSAIK
ncbi:MAG: methyltransferase domain-containing protein [Anaerolineae bacterium]|nr:methyltransferase domain-containing protein [Anaerolineae bacterium]